MPELQLCACLSLEERSKVKFTKFLLVAGASSTVNEVTTACYATKSSFYLVCCYILPPQSGSVTYTWYINCLGPFKALEKCQITP